MFVETKMQKVAISNIAKQIRGVSYKPVDLHNDLNKDSVILLRANNISDGKINFDDVVYVDKKKVSSEQYLQKGDILICASSGSKNLVGKAASVSFDTKCTFGAFCKVIRPVSKYANYLGIYFQSNIYRRIISNVAIGANINNIRNEHIDSLELSIYSDDKNNKIVSTLDKLQSIITHIRTQLEKLDLLVKARFVEMFYDKGYPVLTWNNVFNTTTGKLDSNAAVKDGAYPFFTCSKEILRIDKFAFDQEALLLAGNNAAGKYDVKYYKGKFNAYQRTYVLKLKENWSYQLFRYQLEDKLVYLQQQSLGGLTKYLTMKILGELNFIIPPMEKQIEFEQFAMQVDQSKSILQQELTQAQTLFDSLMQEYFG